MQFTVNSKEFMVSLNLAKAVVPSGVTTVYALELRKNSLWLYAASELIYFKCKCKGVSNFDGKGIIGFYFNVFETLFKGRANINFSVKDDVLNFGTSKNGYSGKISIVPVTPATLETYNTQFVIGKKESVLKLSSTIFGSICTALDRVKLNPTHSNDPLDTFLRVNKKQLEASCLDNFHLGYYTTPCDTGANFQYGASKATFDILSKLSTIYTGETDLIFGNDIIKAINSEYSVSMPGIQTSDTSFTKCKTYLDTLPKMHCSFKYKMSDLNLAIDNIMSIYEDGALVSLSKVPKKDLLEISIKTTLGSINDKINISKFKGSDFKDTFDPRMLLDVLSVIKAETIESSYVDKKALLFKVSTEDASSIYSITVIRK